MGRCIIVLPLYGGEEAALVTPRAGDLLLCADGGYDRAAANGWAPSKVIGDFDSMPLDHVQGCEVVRVPVEKDDTDAALCMAEGRRQGFRQFVLAGGIGGRLDHTLGNLQMMADCALHGEDVTLTGAGNVARFFTPGTYRLPSREGWKLSLFPWNGTVAGLTVRGVKYPLTDYALTPGPTLGVSNEWTAAAAEVSFREGLLLAVSARDAQSGSF